MAIISLELLRREITEIDIELIELIAKRQQVALEIGDYKKTHGLPVFDPQREAELCKLHQQECLKYKVSVEMLDEIFKIIIEESRKVQQ